MGNIQPFPFANHTFQVIVQPGRTSRLEPSSTGK